MYDKSIARRCRSFRTGAYELFLSARAAYKEYSRAGNARARREFEAALEISPQFVSALVGLARTHLEDATFAWSADRTESESHARRFLDAAFEIEDQHAMAHAELAHLLMNQGDYELAREEAMRAVTLDPNLADAHHVVATVLACLGLQREALKFLRQAMKLNPGTPDFYLITLAEAYVALSQYDEALPIVRRIRARRPEWLMAQALMAIVYMGLDQPEEARCVVDNMLAMSPRFTASRWHRYILYPDRPDVENLKQMLIAAGLPE